MQELWKRLNNFFKNIEGKMTYDKYMEMCEQLGQVPVEAEIPPEFHDFPYIVQEAINIYQMLGDRIVADIGYLGKDFSSLNTLFDIYEIEEKELALEVIMWLDRRNIKASRDDMKKAHDKIKNKGKGQMPAPKSSGVRK